MQYYYNFLPNTKKGLSLILYKYSKKSTYLFYFVQKDIKTNILYTMYTWRNLWLHEKTLPFALIINHIWWISAWKLTICKKKLIWLRFTCSKRYYRCQWMMLHKRGQTLQCCIYFNPNFLNLQLIIWTNPRTFRIKNTEFHNSNLQNSPKDQVHVSGYVLTNKNDQ